MSLFKTKELWSVSLNNDQEENFTSHSMTFLRSNHVIPNSKPADLIVTASLEGNLRVYHVVPNSTEAIAEETSTASNLIVETDLKMPVLQIEAGNFSNASKGPQVAVLHPRLLSVYTLEKASNLKEVKGLESYKMNLVYQHKLSRSAYSLCVGPFGGVKSKDFMCVQSLDGSVNLFEQESFAFSRFLPGFLLPGPLAYVPKTDSFVTVSSSFQLESYKYQTLAVATDDPSKDKKDDNIISGKKITADWVLGLGEMATEIHVLGKDQSNKDAPCKIVVLGTRTLFVLHHTGVLAFSKKLDFASVTMLSYPSLAFEEKIMSLIATETNTLMVYEKTTLKWAAQLPFTPLIVKKGNFSVTGDEVISNALVLMSKTGDLFVGVLGTDPSLFSAPRPDARQVNYEDTDIEMASLNTIIKAAQSSDGPSVTQVRDELTVDVDVSKTIEQCYHQTMITEEEDDIPMVRINLTLSASTPLTKVRVAIDVIEPMVVTKSSIVINSLTDVYKTEVGCYLYYPVIPSSMEFTVTAAYLSGQGMPTVVTNVTNLPLRLIVKPCAPIKEADYKVTISTNKPAVSLLDLFPEFVLDSTMSNAAGFQYFGGPYLTVLSSKTSQRYRLQSDNLASLWLVTQSLESRLTRKFAGEKSPALECSYTSSLPLHEYFSEIELHFHKRKKLVTLQETLAERAAQFRSIERRLLSRFKDKTPTALTNLDTLLEGTYRQMQQTTEAVDQCLLEVKRSGNNLSCITNLLVYLTRLTTSMTFDDLAKVHSALTPVMNINETQGWEETTDAALTFLLRTSLAKIGKENQGATPITLEQSKDTTRIKKHVSSVIDRLTKGSRIADDKNVIEAPSPMDFNTTDLDEEPLSVKETKIERDVETPVGSNFGEAGERLRSARSRGLSSASSFRGGSALSLSNPGGPATLHTNSESSQDQNHVLTNGEVAHEPTEDELEAEKHIIDDDDGGDEENADDIW